MLIPQELQLSPFYSADIAYSHFSRIFASLHKQL